MKKYLFIIFLILVAKKSYTQKVSSSSPPSVEKSQFGIETSLLGIWVYYEKGLSPEFAIRGEFGLFPGLFIGVYEETVFTFSPTLRLEPRWYYNLDKRFEKDKRTDNNSGNFIALESVYKPGWFVLSNNESVEAGEGFYIATKWGIRRNIGKHFNFEVGAGIAYAFYATDPTGDEDEGFLPNIHLRIGYVF
jgi:hypothetical protein